MRLGIGSAISPVLKTCPNPDHRLSDDMDFDAGNILDGRATQVEVAAEILDAAVRVVSDERSQSKAMRHQEFILTYETSEPIGWDVYLAGSELLRRTLSL